MAPRKIINEQQLADAIIRHYNATNKPVTVTQLCYLLGASDTVVRRGLKECGGVPAGTEAVKTTVSVFDQNTGWKRWAKGFRPISQ